MKGDTSRGEKLFQKVSQGDKFKKEIEGIRRKFDISPDDFLYTEYGYLLETKEKTDSFISEVKRILQRSALPINTWWRKRVLTHILFNDKRDPLPPLQEFETPFIEIVNHHIGREGSYNDIRLYEGVAQRDIKDFMAKNWKQMEPSYREGTSQKIRGQSTKDIEVLEEASQLMRLTKKELLENNKGLKEQGYAGSTKEIIISKILSDKYGKKITDDALKIRLHRRKRKRR